MSPLTKKFLFSALVTMVLISACAPAQPTQSPEEIANQVATSVALTVAAQNAQTQAAQPVVPEVTNTTLPTQTEVSLLPSPTPIPPTATAVVLPTTSSGGGGGGGGGTTAKPEYACNPFPRLPRDNTILRPGEPFDIKWTIYNTGTKAMVAGLDVKYNSGTQLTSTTIVELPRLEPGENTVVLMDAVAPEKPGTYIMTFLVEGGLCYPYTAIIVEKP